MKIFITDISYTLIIFSLVGIYTLYYEYEIVLHPT